MSETDLPLKVTYASGEPTKIEYYHINHGLMTFEMRDGRAVLDARWNRLSSKALKEGYKHARPSTGDVLRAVERLPFVDAVDASRLYAEEECESA